MTATERLEQFYDLLAKKQVAKLRDFLNPSAWYIQLNTMGADDSPRGVEAVLETLTWWVGRFQNMQIHEQAITPMSESDVGEVGGAVSGFRVRYVIVGESARVASAGRMRLVMSDIVWLDPADRIIRMTSLYQTTP